jgi:hypothetical protein
VVKRREPDGRLHSPAQRVVESSALQDRAYAMRIGSAALPTGSGWMSRSFVQESFGLEPPAGRGQRCRAVMNGTTIIRDRTARSASSKGFPTQHPASHAVDPAEMILQ